jgi:peptidoglycan hydrolase-like protein with peptidoglycan-binding domain
MRDVLDDDERKLKPISVVLVSTAAVLSFMIVYNGLTIDRTPSNVSAVQGTTSMAVSAPRTQTSTVVFKYDVTVEDVQRELLASGQFKGMVDGVMGQRTAQAIQQYQQENGLSVTGEVSAELVNHIRYTRKIKAASQFTGSVAPAQNLDVPAQPLLIKPNANVVAAKPSKRQSILRVQLSLANLGYDLGEPSGEVDEATKAAILQYEMDNGLPMEGVVDAPLLTALGKTTPKKISINN